MTTPGPVPKANSLSNLEQEKSTYRLVVLLTTHKAKELSGTLQGSKDLLFQHHLVELSYFAGEVWYVLKNLESKHTGVISVDVRFLCRAPEPQKPHVKPSGDVMRTNHYDPDEDEEYYRKQLSYFDRRSFDSKAMGQPLPGMNRFHDLPKPAQLSFPYSRYYHTAQSPECCFDTPNN